MGTIAEVRILVVSLPGKVKTKREKVHILLSETLYSTAETTITRELNATSQFAIHKFSNINRKDQNSIEVGKGPSSHLKYNCNL